jgi:hypothetical protein
MVREIRGIRVRQGLREYLAAMNTDNPLRGCPVAMIGDCPANPTETFTHYDAFAYWEEKRLGRIGRKLDILDIGNKKAINALLSAGHNVTSIVLADCGDAFSEVRYLVHDVSDPLPFREHSFDALTSAATLHLIGLGRYGDRINPNALQDLTKELNRVMKPRSHLLLSTQFGSATHLLFNNGWVFDLGKLRELFKGWDLVSSLVVPQPRENECDVVFLHFSRG